MAKYRPLPDYLTIKKSNIEGLGLFTTEKVEEGFNVGITHIVDAQTKELIRTPLGGFINHSEEPNAKLLYVGRKRYLIFLRDLDVDEEITLKYSMYDPT